MVLSRINSQIKLDISQKLIFYTPLHSTPQTFSMEKLEWCGYQTVKKLKISLFLSTKSTNVMDRHKDTA